MKHLALAASAAAVLWAVPGAGAAPPPTLVATVGPGATITLTRGGRKVTALRPGAYRITVRDRSRLHNFVLAGPGVRRQTTVAFMGTRTWNVRFRRGQYVYVCTPHEHHMRGTVRVR